MAEVVMRVGSDFPVNREYATLDAFIADITNVTYPTPGTTAVAEMYNDSAFDSVGILNITNTASNVDNIIIRAAAGHQHNGQPKTGVRYEVSAARGGPILNYDNNKGISVEWIEFHGEGNITTQGIGVIDQSTSVDTADRTKQVIKNCIVSLGENAAGRFQRGIDAGGRPMTVMNCLVYDILSGGGQSNSNAYGIGGDDRMDILGCTVFNVDFTSNIVNYGFNPSGTTPARVYNCAAGQILNRGTGVSTDFRSITNLFTSVSEDGTGTIPNQDPADTFMDTLSSPPDLSLIAGSACIGAGTDLTTADGGGPITTVEGYEIDLFGVDRSLAGRWDIGAYNFSGVALPIFINHYKQMGML